MGRWDNPARVGQIHLVVVQRERDLDEQPLPEVQAPRGDVLTGVHALRPDHVTGPPLRGLVPIAVQVLVDAGHEVPVAGLPDIPPRARAAQEPRLAPVRPAHGDQVDAPGPEHGVAVVPAAELDVPIVDPVHAHVGHQHQQRTQHSDTQGQTQHG